MSKKLERVKNEQTPHGVPNKGEGTQVTKNELHQLIIETEERYERQKSKRALFACLGYGIAIFAIALYVSWPVEISVDILLTLVASIFLGGFLFYVNLLVFTFLFTKSNNENGHLEFLRKQLSEMEK